VEESNKYMFTRIRNRFINKIAKKKNAQLEEEWRNRLVADNFSIICSNCIGGTIYNRLGKEFLSPTINMYFTQRDFIKFAVNLEYYLNHKLQFQLEHF